MKIICIGRNYADHIAELDNGIASGHSGGSELLTQRGNTRVCPEVPDPLSPVFFIKPDTAMLRNNDPFYIPDFTDEVHYETELVVRITRNGRAVEQRFAHRYYDEVGLGIDFTARDVQRRCIEQGLPWEACKGFDRSAAISPEFLRLSDLGKNTGNLHFEMSLNGEVRQRGDTAQMICGVDGIIAYVSRFVTLRMGDLIFTGTPAGVGPVKAGDRLRASLEGRELFDFDIK